MLRAAAASPATDESMTAAASPVPATSPSSARPSTAVLLVQLGTPDAPEPAEVRRYLREFLSDPRVVEIPRVLWWPILNGVVLQTRPKASAERYRSIWTPEGSPLLLLSQRQASLLKGLLGERGFDVTVALAMRYGRPSMTEVLDDLRQRGMTRLVVLPMYPQFAAATSATVFDALADVFRGWRDLPDVRFVRGFHDHAPWLDSLAQTVRRHWDREGRAERLVMSFHGLPQRAVDRGDPYDRECRATAIGLAERLQLAASDWTMTFQSRLGRARWLEPATDDILEELARSGVRSVDVVFPGFVADNLETLEEIAIDGRETFVKAGGDALRVIPCVNDSPDFIAALADLVSAQLGGWPCRRSDRATNAN